MRKVLDRPLPRGKQEVRAPASPGLVRSQAQKVAAAASRTSAEALRLRAPPAEAVRASQMRRQPRCVAALRRIDVWRAAGRRPGQQSSHPVRRWA